ncbi:MAG: type II toxin-antitoxin system prevent-host-death family antitoxin [Pseudomonadota bacterium]|nr:type II toxin-antitoxin system prevent-host-death family antitoxin [Pseudomonadota bacterium]
MADTRPGQDMDPINIYDAKTHLSELVQRASEGEEILIARNGKPVARLVPLERAVVRRPGGWEGKVWLAPDFDAADEEIAALMSDPASEE